MRNNVLRFMFCFFLVGFITQGIFISASYAQKQNNNISSQVKQEQQKQEENSTTLIKNDDGTSNDKIMVNSNLKNQILAELKKRHEKGEYLEISEAMIKALSDSELESLLYSDSEMLANLKMVAEITKQINEKGTDFFKEDTTHEISIKDYMPEDINVEDLYSFPQKTQDSVFDIIKQYTEEKDEAKAILALGGVGGLAMLKRGQDLLNKETPIERVNRHIKMEKFRNEAWVDMNTVDYSADAFYSFSEEDNLKNLTEQTLNKGITLKQEEAMIQELKNINLFSVGISQQVTKEIAQHLTDDTDTSEKDKERMRETFFVNDEKTKQQKEEIKKLRTKRTVKEDLEVANKDIEDTFRNFS